MADLKYCRGCQSDFYNGNNPMGIERCWHLKTARVVTRYRIGTWVMPAEPGAFTKVTTHHCHVGSGYANYKELPDFATEVRDES